MNTPAMPKLPPRVKGPSLRLDRLLSNLGYGSRREVQSMVALGQVTLDGEVLSRADSRVVSM